jgi:hypothetical protein
MTRLTASRCASGTTCNRHERAIAVRVVARKGDGALEHVGAVFRLHSRAFAQPDDALNVLIARLYRKRDHHFIDSLPHQDFFELLDRPNERLQPALASSAPVEWLVHEPHDFVTVHAIAANVMECAPRELASPDDQRSAHLTQVCTFHDATAAAHGQAEHERGQPEIRYVPQRDAAADTRHRNEECHSRSRRCRRQQATDLGLEYPHAPRFVQAEQVKHGRPDDRQQDEQENVFHRDARRKKALRVNRELREIYADEHDQNGCDCTQTVKRGN